MGAATVEGAACGPQTNKPGRRPAASGQDGSGDSSAGAGRERVLLCFQVTSPLGWREPLKRAGTGAGRGSLGSAEAAEVSEAPAAAAAAAGAVFRAEFVNNRLAFGG